MKMSDSVDAALASSPEHPGPYLFRVFLHGYMPALLPDVIPQNVYGFPSHYASPLMPEQWRRPDGYLKLLMGGPGSQSPAMHYGRGTCFCCYHLELRRQGVLSVLVAGLTKTISAAESAQPIPGRPAARPRFAAFSADGRDHALYDDTQGRPVDLHSDGPVAHCEAVNHIDFGEH